jgi:hypothetical protein
MPLHPNQYAYQAVKSVETALHQLMFKVEKALDQQEILVKHGGRGSITPSYSGLERHWRAG